MKDKDKIEGLHTSKSSEVHRQIGGLESPEMGRARTLLKEKEAVLHAMMNATHESLVLIDREGTVLLSNMVGAKRLGTTVEKLVGTCIYDYFPPDVAGSRKKQWERVFATGEPVHFQDSRAGRFFELYAYPVSTDEDKVSRAAIFVREITRYKESEELLKKEREAFSAILHKAPYGIFVNGHDGKFLMVNPEASRITGYTIEDLPTGIAWFKKAYPDPDHRNMIIETWKRDVTIGGVDRTYTVHCKGGAEKELEFRTTRLPDGRTVTIFSDVTQRKKAEKEFRAAHQRLFDIIEFLPDATFVIDHEGKVIAWNHACEEMTGIRKEEIIGKGDYAYSIPFYGERRPILIDYVAMDPDKLPKDYGQVQRKGQLLYAEVFCPMLRDGKGACLAGHASPFFNRRGLVMGAIESLRDITELKHLEAELRQSQKLEAIGTLAEGIAHDFNNILAGIIGFAEMLRDDAPPDSQEHRRLGIVLKGAHRGRDLVRQILKLGRQTGYEQKPVALSGIIDEALKFLRPVLPATVEIRSKFLTEDDTVLADPIQIHQVLMNLCTNGADAMATKGGVLEISITKDCFDRNVPCPHMKPGEYVTLKVRDTGHGMKPEIFERIFDPFFTTKPQGKGTGLGLSVVHGIVKSHGGFIGVESKRGKGSMFSVYLPRMESQASGMEEETPPAKGNKESILFVDDEETLVELNNERLTKLGYEVIATTSSSEALELFKREPYRFDLVITDYMMPHMTGMDLARQMLKVRSDIPIILCTGYDETVIPEKGRKTGIKEFVMKSVSKRDMVAAIRRALDTKIK